MIMPVVGWLRQSTFGLALYCAAAVLLRAQAAAPEQASPAAAPRAASSPSIFEEDPVAVGPRRIPDKMEGVNRAIFKFNDVLYSLTLRPISKGYAYIVPAPVRRGIGRFFHNLAFPTRFVGNILEGKLDNAGVETQRFLVNTVTSLGFLATADRMPDLQEKPSDIGHAFATWGIREGSYIILPLLGPSSIRDGIGWGISAYFLDPVDYLPEWEYSAAARATSVVNESPDQMQAYDQLKAASIDPYVALRDAYSARRASRSVNSTQLPASPTATNPPP